jgi:CRISPR-associated protein Cas4
MNNGKKLLSVTDLCAFKFCPRSLYIKLVLGLREPAKPVMVLGSIRHKVFEEANSMEQGLVEQTASEMKRAEILVMFRNAYAAVLNKSVHSYMPQFGALGITGEQVVVDMFPAVAAQAEERADEIISFSSKTNLFGKELWDKLIPKILSEVRVESDALKLKGIVDRIEVYGSEYVPVEIKTGRVPSSGVWPDHRLQLASYMLLLKDKLKVDVKEAMVKYVKENQTRQVVMNPFMEFEVIEARDSVFSLIENKKLPNTCGKGYCTVCGYGDDYSQHLIKGRAYA